MAIVCVTCGKEATPGDPYHEFNPSGDLVNCYFHVAMEDAQAELDESARNERVWQALAEADPTIRELLTPEPNPVRDDSDSHAYPTGQSDPTPFDDRVDPDVMSDAALEAEPDEQAMADAKAAAINHREMWGDKAWVTPEQFEADFRRMQSQAVSTSDPAEPVRKKRTLILSSYFRTMHLKTPRRTYDLNTITESSFKRLHRLCKDSKKWVELDDQDMTPTVYITL